jgi:hypothetical protein
MLASSGKSDGEVEQVKRRISLRACAWHGVRPLRSRSRRQQEGTFFLDLPACFFRSREVKKLLGPLWA